MKINESVNIGLPKQAIGSVTEGMSLDMPKVLFLEIRTITSNWVTRNKTFYPSESLIGDPNEGTGVISMFYPYPTPILQDHNTSGGMFGGESSPIFGRTYNATFVNDPRENRGWIKSIAAITDPFAIESITSGRFLTVSVGSEVRKVNCSICGQDLVEEGMCEHEKGQLYGDMQCYWIMGPIRANEQSFVHVPSDSNARVVKQLDNSEARMFLGNTSGAFLLDMASGTQVPVENYVSNMGISKRAYKAIVESAEQFYEQRQGVCYKDYLANLSNKQRTSLSSAVKGL